MTGKVLLGMGLAARCWKQLSSFGLPGGQHLGVHMGWEGPPGSACMHSPAWPAPRAAQEAANQASAGDMASPIWSLSSCAACLHLYPGSLSHSGTFHAFPAVACSHKMAHRISTEALIPSCVSTVGLESEITPTCLWEKVCPFLWGFEIFKAL